jgi:hypothetical protein
MSCRSRCIPSVVCVCDQKSIMCVKKADPVCEESKSNEDHAMKKENQERIVCVKKADRKRTMCVKNADQKRVKNADQKRSMSVKRGALALTKGKRQARQWEKHDNRPVFHQVHLQEPSCPPILPSTKPYIRMGPCTRAEEWIMLQTG